MPVDEQLGCSNAAQLRRRRGITVIA